MKPVTKRMVLEGATDEGERLYNVYTSIPGGV